MTLQQIKYIIEISESGSFNKAATKLYVSQPSLTESVKSLESELGFKLFTRSKKGIILTSKGADFLLYARGLYDQYELLNDKFLDNSKKKKKYAITTQHYSFATKAFVEMVKEVDVNNYDFTIKESKTIDVINDVANLKSEIGILFINDYNKKTLERIFESKNLVFTPLIDCNPSVYLWKDNPIAKKEKITLEDLAPFPCIQFDQGEESSRYFAEEVLVDYPYPQIIRTNDRATNLNLMIGLNAYTICSGIICEELNGTDYISKPLTYNSNDYNPIMHIGYITRQNISMDNIGEIYIKKIKEYLQH